VGERERGRENKTEEGGKRMREWERIVRRERERDVYKNAGSSCSSCYGI